MIDVQLGMNALMMVVRVARRAKSEARSSFKGVSLCLHVRVSLVTALALEMWSDGSAVSVMQGLLRCQAIHIDSGLDTFALSDAAATHPFYAGEWEEGTTNVQAWTSESLW
jgi:hypothetical protein